jgi:sulfur carrier protein ThiS adenylyltransferase
VLKAAIHAAFSFTGQEALIKIQLNEIPLELIRETSLHQLRAEQQPDADLLIVNGFPSNDDCQLKNGDQVIMIERGATPDADQLEALMMARHTPGVHTRIAQSRVGIAGAGGLGSNIAISLARVGVGELVIADFDLVEPSNLNRQQYFIDQIGLPKVIALKENLQRINPYVRVEIFNGKIDQQNLNQVFAGVDVMVEAFDAPEQKAMLCTTHLQQSPDCPLVVASGMAGYAASNSIQTEKIRENLYLVGDRITAAEPGQGLMAPRVSIAAGHQANAVLRLLLGESPA